MRKPTEHGTVRACHFVSSGYALDDLRHRRLKIARLDELNDPFELWAIAQPDPRLRRGFRNYKNEMAQRHGVLCFSLSWHNPLLWSHYAEKHHGVALGFDISSDILTGVTYLKRRPALKEINIEVARRLLYTKYIDWKYEQEVRVYTGLEERDESGLYFADFCDQIVLREVIVGPLSRVTRQDLHDALGRKSGVQFTKGRLAFNSFRVVTDQRGFRAIK
jgi:hypothetical protein